MKRKIGFIACSFLLAACSTPSQVTHHEKNKDSEFKKKSPFISHVRQFSFAGRRTGEAYFNKTGDKLVFQSERHPGNPFYQIYLQDLKNGKVQRLSPGHGKTTCAWIHPNNKKALFSSTHLDPRSKSLQKAEFAQRKSGQKRRYAWDYDEHFDIFERNFKGGPLKRLTREKGYDAEASYSPNGKWIAFASNRHAFTDKLSPEDQAQFKKNSSYMLDIYIMKSDGTNVKRLTKHKGYDGGPFFSPDGRRIVWRRFSADGRTAEVFTMNLDGSEKKQLTQLNSMSWAPFYHPSGDYILFTTSKHGHHNFELYMIDTEAKNEPIRVSFLEGFDGLPVFSPDGQKVYWTRKYRNGESQVFVARWNDVAARKALGLSHSFPKSYELVKSDVNNFKNWVNHFASPKMKGRMTGSKEESQYTREIADYFQSLGLKKYRGSYFQNFPFVSGVLLGPGNRLANAITKKEYLPKKDWLPLAMSKNGEVPTGKVVFAGYGLETPQTNDFDAFSSYEGTDVKGKWVMVFRYVPEDIDAKRRQHYLRYSKLEFKLLVARQKGAKGLIVVSGPQSNVKSQIIPLVHSEASSEASISAISISDEVAQDWLSNSGKNLGQLQKSLDRGEKVSSFEINNLALEVTTQVQRKMGQGRSVLGLLKVPRAKQTLVIGAHGDHLGDQPRENSLARSTDLDTIHYGADDNASGMSVVVDLAKRLSRPNVKKNLRQNVLFVIWSGEELGILGSNHFVKNNFNSKNISAYLNLDMVGKLENKPLLVQGAGSSAAWDDIVEKATLFHDLPIQLHEDPYLPTDAMPFYISKVPVLSLFTGAHQEYHSPRDKPETIDYEGLKKISDFTYTLATHVASQKRGPRYAKVDKKSTKGTRGGFRIYLGTIPDYANKKVKGVKLSGVIKGGPAEAAGLKGGDIIVEFSKFKIENIHDYVYSLQSLKPGQATKITVLRSGERKELQITPASKE